MYLIELEKKLHKWVFYKKRFIRVPIIIMGCKVLHIIK